jgi:hypothetical protein
MALRLNMNERRAGANACEAAPFADEGPSQRRQDELTYKAN